MVMFWNTNDARIYFIVEDYTNGDSCYWCKQNLKYTVYYVLQKKILTTVPVFKPYKDLPLNRALSLILHFTVYTKNILGRWWPKG